MKLSEIKAEGYDGLHVHCNHCRRMIEIAFAQLPDGELIDVGAKLRCSKCGRPASHVTVYRDKTKNMLY